MIFFNPMQSRPNIPVFHHSIIPVLLILVILAFQTGFFLIINDSQIYEKIADTGFAKVVDFHDDRRFFLLDAVKSVMQMERRFL